MQQIVAKLVIVKPIGLDLLAICLIRMLNDLREVVELKLFDSIWCKLIF